MVLYAFRVKLILGARKTKVAFLEQIEFPVVVDKGPHSDVKLIAFDQERVLYILLKYEGSIPTDVVVDRLLNCLYNRLVALSDFSSVVDESREFLETLEEENISSLVEVGWLHDPNIS